MRTKEQERERQRIYRAEHADKVRATRQRFHERHPGRQAELMARWLATPGNVERKRVEARELYKRNRDQIKARSKARYKADPKAAYAKARERLARKRAEPGERERLQAKHNELVKAWRERHPERAREHVRARRGHRLNAAGSHTLEQWLARVQFYGWHCRYCRTELTEKTLTLDHAIPLSRGGSEWPANCLPACLSCNSQKHDQTLTEYLRGCHAEAH